MKHRRRAEAIRPLHQEQIRHKDGDNDLSDNSRKYEGGKFAIHFRNHEPTLCDYISKSSVVVGCVAWLTSEPILRALAKVPHGVSIVVQKEDFLRPDMCAASNWKRHLRGLYDALKPFNYLASEWAEPYFPWWGSPVSDYWEGKGFCCEQATDHAAIRCMGNYNRDKDPAFPRMHNKFLVFIDVFTPVLEEWEYDDPEKHIVVPRAVWTGSFNLTKNATASFENAVYIESASVARLYLAEWAQIMALSEPLDWEYDWCRPEWIETSS